MEYIVSCVSISAYTSLPSGKSGQFENREKGEGGGGDEFVDFVSNAGPYAMNATSEPYVVNIGFCMCYVDRLSIFKLWFRLIASSYLTLQMIKNYLDHV